MPDTLKTLSRPKAAYQQVASHLRDEITQGRIATGDSLPSYRQISSRFGVALATVQQAVALLISEGLVKATGNRIVVSGGVAILTEWRKSTPKAAHVLSQKNGEQKAAAVDLFQRPTIKSIRLGMIARYPNDNPDPSSVDRNSTVQMVELIEQVIAEKGGTTDFFDVHDCDVHETLVPKIQELIEREVNAIALLCIDEADITPEALKVLQASGIPTIVAGFQDIRLPLRHVFHDMRYSGSQGVQHLIEQGCRHIVYYCPLDYGWTIERLMGVRDAVLQYGVGPGDLTELLEKPVVRPVGDDQIAEGYRRAATVLPLLYPTTGIVACNDNVALGLMKRAAEAGFEAGRDYKIVGFDGLYIGRLAGLTTVPQPIKEIAVEAARLICEPEGSASSTIRTSVHSRIIPRRSSLA